MPLTLPTRSGTKVPRSQTERLWFIGGGLIAFVLILIGYFFFISPQRSETSDVNGQIGSARQDNAGLQQHIDTLRAQNKNLATYRSELANAQRALPSTSGVSDFLRTLQALGNSTLTDVTQLTVGEPAPVTPVAPPAGASPSPSSTATPSASPTNSTAVPGAPAAAALYSMNITAQVSGSTSGLDKFLDQLQNVQPRAVLISQISEGAAAGAAGAQGNSGTTSLQLTMQAFVAPSPLAGSAASPSTPSN